MCHGAVDDAIETLSCDPFPMLNNPASAPIDTRIDFICELAERLHSYGTTAQRLESALIAVARQLEIECDPWSNPTGMILSFRPIGGKAKDPETTRLIRLPLGENALHKLAETDRIAEEVLAGKLDVAHGHAQLQALDRPMSRMARWAQVLGFGLAAFGVACLLRLPWLDVATAAVAGLSIGLVLNIVNLKLDGLKDAEEVIAAAIATLITVVVSTWIAPLNFNTVIIAAVIVLLPGMGITNAVNELTSQHLVSGTSRLAGALTVVLKLAIGMMIITTLAKVLGMHPQVRMDRPQPLWVEGLGMITAAYSFAILFRAGARDYALVMMAAITGYLVSRLVAMSLGNVAGVFAAAFCMTLLGNYYARAFKRPGALVRLPGIIMLVPGSLSFRSVINLLQQQSTEAGTSILVDVLNVLLALIAGILLGNLMLSSRRSL